MGMCRTVYRQIKIEKLIKSIFLSLLICICVPYVVNAEPVSQERLLEQLTEAFTKGNVYEVIQDGTGDFTSITEGIAAVTSEDTLLIYPGIYEESIEVNDKTVNLIGTDRDYCILQYDSSNYNKIPLTFGAGYISNMTIYGYKENTKEEKAEPLYSTNDAYNNSSVESIEEWQKLFPGYAIHIDQNYSYGKEICIENCRIISNNNQCVGIGCRGENKITFIDCELISNGSGGCIYFHNTESPELAGNAYFTLQDCSLRNYKCPYVISMHSMGGLNPVYLTFQNVKVNTIAYERKGAYNSTNMNIGFDVDTIAALENTVNYYTRDKSFEFITSLRDKVSTKEEAPNLPEGVTYLKMVEIGSEYKDKEKLPEVKARKRQTINIYNSSKIAGTGWCGLDYIYLTQESYGNTLSEMNYPMIEDSIVLMDENE